MTFCSFQWQKGLSDHCGLEPEQTRQAALPRTSLTSGHRGCLSQKDECRHPRGPGLLKELRGSFSKPRPSPLLCLLYGFNEKSRHCTRDCTNNFWGIANPLSRERLKAANASGKISEWKEGGFTASGRHGVSSSPAERKSQLRLSSPSSRRLIRNLGAGPGLAQTCTLSVGTHSLFLPLTLSIPKRPDRRTWSL